MCGCVSDRKTIEGMIESIDQTLAKVRQQEARDDELLFGYYGKDESNVRRVEDFETTEIPPDTNLKEAPFSNLDVGAVLVDVPKEELKRNLVHRNVRHSRGEMVGLLIVLVLLAVAGYPMHKSFDVVLYQIFIEGIAFALGCAWLMSRRGK